LLLAEKRNNWTREETILAFDLYCKIPFSKISKTNKEIIELANLIGRTPSAVGLGKGGIFKIMKYEFGIMMAEPKPGKMFENIYQKNKSIYKIFFATKKL